MPSTSSGSARGRARPVAAPAAHPRRPLGRGFAPSAAPRPQIVPFAAAFGFLVAAEDLYLGWLLWGPESGLAWYVAAAAVLAAGAVTGAVLVLRGRGRGWLVLAVASVLPLLAFLVLVLLFGALGGGQALAVALLLLVGPVGCLALTLRRPVREWTSRGRVRRSPGGRRTAPSAR